MSVAFALPTLAAATRLTVVIPARDEETTLRRTLTALDRQITLDGAPLCDDSYDVVVLANGCRDATAAVARAHATTRRGPRIAVVEVDFPAHVAHVGTARRAVMDAAALRFLRAGLPRGIVASTDADTCVDARWVAATFYAMRRADAVAGRIALEPLELAKLDRVARLLYLRDAAHSRLVGELEALRDPVEHDPLPRHGQHYGASFAVTAQTYVRAGGVPPRRRLEDLGLYRALERIDARVRHSPRVRVATSARRVARVDGGFATFLSDLETRRALQVEAPELTVLRLDGRAALRRLWHGSRSAADTHIVLWTYGCARRGLQERFNATEPFGANVARFEAFATQSWSRYAPVAIEAALPIVRALRLRANAVRPTRCTIASGAG